MSTLEAKDKLLKDMTRLMPPDTESTARAYLALVQAEGIEEGTAKARDDAALEAAAEDVPLGLKMTHTFKQGE